ncbi:MAG TPA: hypothetical protein VHB73_00945 [Alphaproteobacteria bacterium]|nr:hypothetical protein [Alphaproteobacteria bacterium]
MIKLPELNRALNLLMQFEARLKKYNHYWAADDCQKIIEAVGTQSSTEDWNAKVAALYPCNACWKCGSPFRTGFSCEFCGEGSPHVIPRPNLSQEETHVCVPRSLRDAVYEFLKDWQKGDFKLEGLARHAAEGILAAAALKEKGA